MPNGCYVSIEGEKQGKFKGEQSFSKLAADKMTAIRVSFGAVSPRDVTTGLATGKRLHDPVRFTKENGASTPQIFQALTQNENLKKVVFEFTRANASSGKEEVHFVVTLTNASVSKISTHLDQTHRGDPFDGKELVDVELTFETILIEDKIGKTTAQDDWAVD